jgi:uncharacterized membrane protein
MDKELTILISILVLILLIFILIPLTFMFPMFQMHMQMMGSSFLPSPLFFVFLIIAIIALIIGLVLVIRYVFEKETTKKETNEVKKVYVFPLTEEEKKVIEFLKQNEGKSEQKIIQKTFNLSKVKTHRILTRLESRGIIIRAKRGREMMVILKQEEVA